MLVNLDQVLKRAKAEKYAVGLFNTHDTDMLEAAIAAAIKKVVARKLELFGSVGRA